VTDIPRSNTTAMDIPRNWAGDPAQDSVHLGGNWVENPACQAQNPSPPTATQRVSTAPATGRCPPLLLLAGLVKVVNRSRQLPGKPVKHEVQHHSASSSGQTGQIPRQRHETCGLVIRNQDATRTCIEHASEPCTLSIPVSVCLSVCLSACSSVCLAPSVLTRASQSVALASCIPSRLQSAGQSASHSCILSYGLSL
jgi:hypothetical protein